MRRKLYPIAAGILSLFFMLSCSSDDSNPSSVISNRKVNDWIYNTMANNYLWNIQKLDNSQDVVSYFNSTLTPEDTYTIDGKQYRYSQIYKKSSGTTVSYDPGFEYAINKYGDGKVYYVVYYVKPNTSAEKEGLKRGYLITKVNGQEPTSVNDASSIMQSAYAKGEKMSLTVRIPGFSNFLTLDNVMPQVAGKENPIFVVKDTTLLDNKKIGYLLYNNFDKTFTEQLKGALQKLSGIDYLILDLRYNAGGDVSNAVTLATALVKNNDRGGNFITYKQRGVSTISPLKLNEDASIPVLGDNLKRLYIITGKSTTATSEIFINSLKAYYKGNLTLVGDHTLGYSNVAISQPQVYENDWVIQFAVAYFADKDGNYDYRTGFAPNIPISEVNDDNVSNLLGAFGTMNESIYKLVIMDILGSSDTRSATINYRSDNPIVTSILQRPSVVRTTIE